MSGNGAPMSTRPLIFRKAVALSTRSRSKKMILPLVVIDVHKAVTQNPDYRTDRGSHQNMGEGA